jgi:hypothetical protein
MRLEIALFVLWLLAVSAPRAQAQELDQLIPAVPDIVTPAPCLTVREQQLVELPPHAKQSALADMQDRLAALRDIQASLSRRDLHGVADIAEKRLGQSSLPTNAILGGETKLPQEIRDIDKRMRDAASHLARLAQPATANMEAALAALSDVMQACTACHARYRLH